MPGARGELNDGPAVVVAKLKDLGAQGAIVAQRGQLDISELLAAGWRLSGETHYVAGKRIRMLTAPERES